MSPPLSTLRPLALGEIIDRAASFWRQHLKPLFLLSLGFNLAVYCLTKVLQPFAQRARVALTGGSDLETQVASSVQFLLVSGAATFLSLWLYYLNTVAVARYVVPTQLGETVTPAQALGRAGQRVGALTAAYVLSLLWGAAILFLMMLPGVLVSVVGTVLSAMRASDPEGRRLGLLVMGGGVVVLGVGLLGGLLWYLLRFCLLAPVLAMEDLSGLRSFRRAGELLSGRVGPGLTGRVSVRAMLIVTVVSIVLLAVGLLCGLPALLLQFAYGNPFDRSAPPPEIPLAFLVPAELLQVFGQAVFGPLGLVVYAMLYLDMRVRREGLDLEHDLASR